jgi:hypothetical protein
MNDRKGQILLRNLKIIILISVPIYLISSYLTGVRIIVSIDGQMIDRGYYEHFTFLIISSLVLSALLFVLHCFVRTVENKKMEFGLKAIFISLILFGTVLSFCIFSSLFNTVIKWGEFEFMLVFLTSVPLTTIFLFGLSLFVFGKLSSLYSTKSKKHNNTTGADGV